MLNKLVQEFINGCLEISKLEPWDYKANNKIVKQLENIIKKVYKIEKPKEFFDITLNHENRYVRRWAACYSETYNYDLIGACKIWEEILKNKNSSSFEKFGVDDAIKRIKSKLDLSNKLDINKNINIFNMERKPELLNFLTKHKFIAFGYMDFIKSDRYGYLKNNKILLNDKVYSIELFLGPSNNDDVDLLTVNESLDLNIKKIIAIAKCYGDDIICIKPKEHKIYLCKVDDKEGENLTLVAHNFTEFSNLIK